MERVIKNGVILGLILVCVWFLFPGASAAEWSEGILAEVKGTEALEGNNSNLSNIELMIEGGNIFRLDPKVKIKDLGGSPISLDMLAFPSKIRFQAEKGIIKEIILIEVSPR